MRKNIFYILIIMLSIGWYGCDKELDILPTDEIDGDIAFATIDGLSKGVIGCYSEIGFFNFVGFSDRAGDDLQLSAQNTGQGVQTHNWTYVSDEGDAREIYRNFYYPIDRANRMLAYAENFDENGEDGDLVKQLKGELYFIRAFCHFELARAFCKAYDASDPLGLPYMEVSEIGTPARISQGDYFAKINADLVTAKGLLPDDLLLTGRANQTAVTALQASVALHMGDWPNAESFATDAINGAFSLASAAEYLSVWEDANDDNVEVIFKLLRNGGGLNDIYTRSSNGDIFFHPSIEIRSLYGANDIRQNFFGVDGGGNDIVAKHDGRPGADPGVNDIKAIRVSEMYLVRAEAHAMQNELADATADVNALLAERVVGFTPMADFANSQLAMDEIRLQRRLELAYEGFRFYDLKRWGLGVDRIDEDVVLASGQNLPAGNFRFVLPIPQQEIFANSNMVQNDGYGN
jgi:starch-binding outer membrane protein, SusD/RagB family